MAVITLAPPYIPLIQKPKCCAAACMQMILCRHGYGLHDQEDIAIRFGVKVGADDADAFKSSMPVMQGFNIDEGISTLDSADVINTVFAEKGCPLRVEAHKYSAIHSLETLVSDALRADYDVWVEYHRDEISAGSVIHDGLIESYDSGVRSIVLIDPNPRRKQRICVAMDTLERAISPTFGRELGVLIVGPR